MKTQRTTPAWLAKHISTLALTKSNFQNNTKVSILEPSAGEGLLIDLLKTEFTNSENKITCIELNEDKCNVCKSKGYQTIHTNFLYHKFQDEQFDVIIAAPPFNNNIDVFHIAKMYSLLSSGGILVTLTSPYWLTNNEIHQCEFREMLASIPHSIEMLPDKTFIEKGKTVPTAILIIKKF